MLKKTITTTDWDDNPQTIDLWFNITTDELAENLDIEDQFQEFQKVVNKPQEEMTNAEKVMFLNLVKRMLSIAYGERDGDAFDKDDGNAYKRWRKHWSYSGLLDHFLQHPTELDSFLTEIMPKVLREQIAKLEPSEKDKLQEKFKERMQSNAVSVQLIEPAPRVENLDIDEFRAWKARQNQQ